MKCLMIAAVKIIVNLGDQRKAGDGTVKRAKNWEFLWQDAHQREAVRVKTVEPLSLSLRHRLHGRRLAQLRIFVVQLLSSI
jgi:hypothetical protein